MSRDLTTGPTDRRSADDPPAIDGRALVRPDTLLAMVAAGLLGALLFALAYQIPVVHPVDIGGYDTGYVLGFYDPEQAGDGAPSYLDGSDGSARWTRGESYLLFPQAGLPARVTIRLRGRSTPNPPSDVAILVNGVEVDRFQAVPDWQERSLAVVGGLLKPEDVLVAIRTNPAALGADDPRRVGVLIDRAIYAVGPAPVLPYPAQLIYAVLAAGLLALLLTPDARTSRGWDRRAGLWLAGWLALLTLAFLLFYRLQPLYPAPLRGLMPMVCVVLAALLAVCHASTLVRMQMLPAILAPLGIIAWTGTLLVLAGDHLVLSVPGVEKDFRVFATRATLTEIFHADGFYNLGYPFLLWLARPLTEDSAFLAGRLIAALSAGLLLAATWRLAWRLLGPWPALMALLALALSPLVVQYGLYLGSDMPFAALCSWALALLVEAGSKQQPLRIDQAQGARREIRLIALWPVALAGLVAGCAFLVRHPGLALLPLGWLAIGLGGSRLLRDSQASPAESASQVIHEGARRGTKAEQETMVGRRLSIVYRLSSIVYRLWVPLLAYTLAFALAILPQLFVNMRDTGQLFYSQQAKNIWLAVHAGGDWGRWGEAANNITLVDVILQDPGRFLSNLTGNLRAFAGSGGEDTSEFGRAIQLRLLGFPANWLALVGLLGWMFHLIRRPPWGDRTTETGGVDKVRVGVLLLWVAIYIPAISVGFALPRFFLVVAPVYALAAAWALERLAILIGGARAHLALGLALAALLWGGFGIGATYVLRPATIDDTLPGQPAETLVMARLLAGALGPSDRFIARVPTADEAGLALTKYSAVAHRAITAPVSDDPAELRATGATYLLWSDSLGAAPVVGPELGRAGPYTLFRITR